MSAIKKSTFMSRIGSEMYTTGGWSAKVDNTTIIVIPTGPRAGQWTFRGPMNGHSCTTHYDFALPIGWPTRSKKNAPLWDHRTQRKQELLASYSTTKSIPRTSTHWYLLCVIAGISAEYAKEWFAQYDRNEQIYLAIKIMQGLRSYKDREKFAKRFFQTNGSIKKSLPSWMKRIPNYMKAIDRIPAILMKTIRMFPKNWETSWSDTYLLAVTISLMERTLGITSWVETRKIMSRGQRWWDLLTGSMRMTNTIPDNPCELRTRILNHIQNKQWDTVVRLHDRMSALRQQEHAAWQERYKRQHTERMAKYTEWHATSPLTDSLGVTVLRTDEQFRLEGETMQHCIRSYFTSFQWCVHIAADEPTSAMFCVKKSITGQITIHVVQHYGIRNSYPTSEAEVMLKQWASTQDWKALDTWATEFSARTNTTRAV